MKEKKAVLGHVPPHSQHQWSLIGVIASRPDVYSSTNTIFLLSLNWSKSWYRNRKKYIKKNA